MLSESVVVGVLVFELASYNISLMLKNVTKKKKIAAQNLRDTYFTVQSLSLTHTHTHTHNSI